MATLSVAERQPCQSRFDAQRTRAGLALLHALLSHYARQLWDVQRTRIALANRVGAMERDGLAKQWTLPLAAAVHDLAVTERAIDRQLTRLAEQHFLSRCIADAPGVGLPGLGRLLGVTGPLDRFATGAKLGADLEAKLAGLQSPRGWGLFLIKNLVDDMRVSAEDGRHTVELTMSFEAVEAEGGDHGRQNP